MSYAIDPQLAEKLSFLQPQLESLPPFVPGDTTGWRQRMNAFFDIVNQQIEPTEPLEHSELEIPWQNERLHARRYVSGSTLSKGIVLFVHGGGGVAGSVDQYNKIVSQYVMQSGVDFISLEYGLAPETNGLIQTGQVIAALNWLHQNAAELDIDAEKIVLMGDSGGGGIVASAALYARDHHIAFAGLVMIYPMLDHRVTTPSPELLPLLSISAPEIETGWSARLGNDLAGVNIAYISAALATDLSGLPPTYLDTGELDLFCQENIAWSNRSAEAGVQIEFHLYPGVNHGFDLIAPESDTAKVAMKLRCSAIRRMLAS